MTMQNSMIHSVAPYTLARHLLRARKDGDWKTFAALLKDGFECLSFTFCDSYISSNAQLESVDVESDSLKTVVSFECCLARDSDDILAAFAEPELVTDVWYGSGYSTREMIVRHRWGVAAIAIAYPEYSDDETDGSGSFQIIWCSDSGRTAWETELSHKALHAAGSVVGSDVPSRLEKQWTDGFCGALGCDLNGLLMMHDSILAKISETLARELPTVAPGSEAIIGSADAIVSGLSKQDRFRLGRELIASARLAEQAGLPSNRLSALSMAFERIAAFAGYPSLLSPRGVKDGH